MEDNATTFVAVFVAELGDKTQLATLGLSARDGSKLGVFIGSASALVATSLIAVRHLRAERAGLPALPPRVLAPRRDRSGPLRSGRCGDRVAGGKVV